jgi:hypothetical protein
VSVPEYEESVETPGPVMCGCWRVTPGMVTPGPRDEKVAMTS